MYKTFTEGLKTNKKETFGVVTVGQYSKITAKKESCPICRDNAIHMSNCQYNVKNCKMNHFWFTDRSGNVRIGKPN